MVSNEGRPKCVGCGHVLRPEEQDRKRLACFQCEGTAASNLELLAGPDGLFAQLVWKGTLALTPTGGHNNSDPAVKSSKTVAPPPVRIQAMSLLGAGGVVHTLQRWVGTWYADLGFRAPVWRGQHHFVMLVAPGGVRVPRPGQLDNTVRALLNNLPWAAEHRDDFGQFAHQVHRFVEESRMAIDPTAAKPSRVLIGRCPASVDGLICGHQLMADPYAAAIRCPNCGTSWRRADWLSLGRQMHTR